MRSIFTFWDTVVELSAVIAFVVIALGLMVGVVDRDRVWRHLGTTLAALVLLLMLPPIMAGIWHSISLFDQLGIIILFGLTAFIGLYGGRQRQKRRPNRNHD